MTAPRWITEAVEASGGIINLDDADLARALIERLPLEAIGAVCRRIDDAARSLHPEAASAGAVEIVRVLTDGDPEVVQLTELYQGACRVLDEAGVPYAYDHEQQVVETLVNGIEVVIDTAQPLEIAGRIRWLVQQRPIRAELDSARATQKLAEEMATKYMAERDEARAKLGSTFAELERVMNERAHDAECLHDELSVVDGALGEAVARCEALTIERDLALQAGADLASDRGRFRTERDEARGSATALESRVIALEDAIRRIVEGDQTAGEVRRSLAELIGCTFTEIDVARVDMAAILDASRYQSDSQAARITHLEGQIESLEVEISELEDEIYVPDGDL
ncbi:MAG TPA: hypothetical protein VLN57_21330 [Xanthobacteraceae bacterium]|nr:hypothetical protein [Xanthobacteraceae bacterium]